MSIPSSAPEFFKQSYASIQTNEMDAEATQKFIKNLFTATNLYDFHLMLNLFTKKAIQNQRCDTIKNVLDALSVLSVQISYDIMKVNWLEMFEFLEQLSNGGSCLKCVTAFAEEKQLLPERPLSYALEKGIQNKKYKEVLKIANLLVHQTKGGFNYRDLLKAFLAYDQLANGFELLKLIDLDQSGSYYMWENFISFCCLKDFTQEAREMLKLYFAKVLPKNSNEIENIYTCFLKELCKSKSVKKVLAGIVDDVCEFQLKVKGSVFKDALLKLLDERIDQATFYKKFMAVRYNLDSWAVSSLITRLIQLKRKIEVQAIIDMVINDQGFQFKFNELSLSNTDMKYIVFAQNQSIKCLMNENDSLVSQNQNNEKSDSTSIIDRLSFDDMNDDFDDDFEHL